MNIRFLIPGKCREKYIIDGQNEYLKRLSRYGKISLVSLEEEPLPSSPSDAQIKKALSIEADRALKQIKDDECLFLVDIHAKNPSTKALADKIEEKMKTNGNLDFLVGSSYGLDDKLRKRANYSFSLGEMTYTHYMAMMLVIEQVYRSMKIIRGEAYDK